ncbi:Protein kinase-like domain protein [Niveomyces insectorum RCEF 264]|uniref:Protein kinase-like domain protein n=1 Tax=Niveomyces insectorum RCEF 264 TaxID=1081102 RepID=A0A167W3C8_9HYPO|nr:Protein kinase-like domain protein [Niveomyces insectorum RCEF 264]
MEILENNEAFVLKDGDLVFDHTKLILRSGSDFFLGRSPLRNDPCTINVENLDLQRIPTESIWPAMEARYTKAPEPPPPECFIKRPSLMYFGDTPAASKPAQQLLDELEACEILRLHPHPNIAQYFGCISQDDKITGLCFRRYPMTLAERLRDKSASIDKARCLRGVRDGLKHMHGLGLVHNDINPSNIMLDGSTPIIIDFDSCKKQGEKLGLKSGTREWTKEAAEYALSENDDHSLAKLEEFLHE